MTLLFSAFCINAMDILDKQEVEEPVLYVKSNYIYNGKPLTSYFQIPVRPDTTISDVKEILAQNTGISPKGQRLLFLPKDENWPWGQIIPAYAILALDDINVASFIQKSSTDQCELFHINPQENTFSRNNANRYCHSKR